MTTTRTATLLLLLALARPAAAQERPREDDLFGAPPPAEAAPATSAPAADGAATGRPAAEARVQAKLRETDNPLQIGGLLYLRASLSATEEGPPSSWSFSAPSIVDVFLDARPSERVRAYGLVRSFYDPTVASPGLAGALSGVSQSGTASQTATLQSKLDQLWLKADIGQVLFVTAGRQHVRWGVGRLWSPTDFLHTTRRNPLATFDDRTGTTMLKLHLPWERRGWNLYAMAVAEPLVTRSPALAAPLTSSLTAPRTNQLGAIGGGARAEVVLGGWELGLDGVAQRGMDARLGVDVSTGFWEIDLRGEVALRRGSDQPILRDVGTAGARDFQLFTPRDLRTAAVAQAEWQHKYSDEDTFTIGAEYFWNQNGYSDPQLYLPVQAAGLASPLYLGRHYAGAYLLLPRPGSWDLHTFSLSVLGNLSDKSFVGRLDWSMTVLTYLTLEAYLAGHVGSVGSEFRFGLDGSVLRARVTPALENVCRTLGGGVFAGTCALPPIRVAPPLVDAGVAVRVSL